MTTLSYKVAITGVDHCMEAIEWCTRHIKEEHWSMEMPDLRPRYVFNFSNTKEANWFKLKWQ